MMNHLPRRKNSLRFNIADYSDPGGYFITICTYDRLPLFGEIIDDEMHCNSLGNIVWEVWKSLPTRYPLISIDEAIVMPDHFHGIIFIHDNPTVGAIHELPLPNELPLRDELPLRNNEINMIDDGFPSSRAARRKMTIPLIIGHFKMNSSKKINILRNSPGTTVWQRNYYDRILRDDQDIDALTEYIALNPQHWRCEKE